MKSEKFRKFLESQSSEVGAGLVEYSLLTALIAMVCIVAVQAVGQETADSLCESAIYTGPVNLSALNGEGYYDPQKRDCCVDWIGPDLCLGDF